MKNPIRITIIILAMFMIAQLIGLAVINFYSAENIKLPYGFDQSEQINQTPNFYYYFIANLFISFIIVLIFLAILMKFKSGIIMKLWFFSVVVITIAIVLNALVLKLSIPYSSGIAGIIALILAYFKVFRKNVITHNLTELLIYPGIATLFVPMLNLTTTIILLILISAYDIWAVWKSKFMMNMVKFQMKNVGLLGGFIIPYASKKVKEKIKLLKLKYKNKIPDNVIAKNKLKVGVAILGGGDIAFSIIAAGAAMKAFGGFYYGLLISSFAALALLYIFIFGEKRKPYPAMPYITIGVLLGYLLCWVISRV